MHALLLAILLAAQPQQPDGKTVFDANCRKCHGVKGVPAASMKRMMPSIPDFNAKLLSAQSLKQVETAIGKGKGDMKPFADKLSADQITAVAKYVFELAGTQPKK